MKPNESDFGLWVPGRSCLFRFSPDEWIGTALATLFHNGLGLPRIYLKEEMIDYRAGRSFLIHGFVLEADMISLSFL